MRRGRTTVQSRPLSRTMSSISARSEYALPNAAFTTGASRVLMKNPSPGSCFGGLGRPGDGTVPTGAALTTTMRRAAVACIARTMAPVPREAIPTSAIDRGPRQERTASAPSTANSSAAGSGAARSVSTASTSNERRLGSRTTPVTSCPAARACWRTCPPIRPVAATIVSFMHGSASPRAPLRRDPGVDPLLDLSQAQHQRSKQGECEAGMAEEERSSHVHLSLSLEDHEHAVALIPALEDHLARLERDLPADPEELLHVAEVDGLELCVVPVHVVASLRIHIQRRPRTAGVTPSGREAEPGVSQAGRLSRPTCHDGDGRAPGGGRGRAIRGAQAPDVLHRLPDGGRRQRRRRHRPGGVPALPPGVRQR